MLSNTNRSIWAEEHMYFFLGICSKGFFPEILQDASNLLANKEKGEYFKRTPVGSKIGQLLSLYQKGCMICCSNHS